MYSVVRTLVSQHYGFPDMEVCVADTMTDAVKVLEEWWEEGMNERFAYDEVIEWESWHEEDKAFIKLWSGDKVYFEAMEVTE